MEARALEVLLSITSEITKRLVGREDRIVAVFLIFVGSSIILVGTYVDPQLVIDVWVISMRPYQLLIGTGSLAIVVTVLYILSAELYSIVQKAIRNRARQTTDTDTTETTEQN